ncbi:TPA: hypothetical protein MIP74_27810 [Klebsiella pneumoniae]|nr:hypothetical protein [Klebsiella pneumoniae]HBY7726347.1 hypothetical protein [Klebsiella pneumoniae]
MVCCRFYLTAAPLVANLSGAVRVRDVMVNGFLCGLFHCAFRAPLPPLNPLRTPFSTASTTITLEHIENSEYEIAHN